MEWRRVGLQNASIPWNIARASPAQQDREGRELAVALGVAGFGAGNVMMFTVPAWAGLFGQELNGSTLTVMYWMAALVATPCALFAGQTFFRSAWAVLKRARTNMDVPISIGVTLATGLSLLPTALPVVAFLASEDSGFMTGSTITINGGQYMLG